jgi:multidrug efflux system outer membrane protein
MKRLLYILAIAALLQACKAGKNYKGTEFVQPTSYRQADTLRTVVNDTVNTDSLELDYANIRWWEMFNDPVLDTLVKEAFAKNLNALIAAETVLQSRYALRIQNADLLPKFNAGGQIQRGNFLFNQIGPTSDIILGQASVTWEIDIWGKFRRLSESARADLMASEYGYRGVMISLVSEVAANYFDLLRAKSQYEIAKRNARSRDSMTQIIIARYDKGIVPKIDVDQAKIQYAIAAGSIPQYKREIVQLENSLSVLLGRNPGTITTGFSLEEQNMEVDLPLQTPVQLLHRRPDLIAAEYGVMSANALTGAAKANR